MLLAKSVGASRFVYNWGLAESQRAYELTGKRPRLGELKARLVQLKKGEAPWLYEVSAHIGQQALVDLDRAFERFFKGLSGRGAEVGLSALQEQGRARLRPPVRSHARGTAPAAAEHRPRAAEGDALGTPLRGTDSLGDGPLPRHRWFVSLAVERERLVIEPRVPTSPSDVVGIDLGLTAAAVIHDGSTTRLVEPQRALRTNLRKLRRLDRQVP